MPTPLAHGVAGLAAAQTAQFDWRSWRFVVLAIVLASLPDIDFLPGLLVGSAGAFHRGPTHSLVGAFLFSVPVAALLTWIWPRLPARQGHRPASAPRFLAWYAFVVPVYASHLALDLVSLDTVGNSGLQLWWPFSNTYANAPLPIPQSMRGLFDLEFGPGPDAFFGTLFSVRAAVVYVLEAALFSPLLLIPWVVSRVRRGRISPATLEAETADCALEPRGARDHSSAERPGRETKQQRLPSVASPAREGLESGAGA
jgi:membrane-bound metal-dependent hydrolase YbcI (DUF457 family)